MVSYIIHGLVFGCSFREAMDKVGEGPVEVRLDDAPTVEGNHGDGPVISASSVRDWLLTPQRLRKAYPWTEGTGNIHLRDLLGAQREGWEGERAREMNVVGQPCKWLQEQLIQDASDQY
jgi:hypothetical protein